MSRDGYMVIDTGGSEPAVVAEIGNYTHNCGPMWHLAVRRTSDLPDLDATHGMTGAEVEPILRGAYTDMYLNPDVYRPMNPANGWGDYETAREYLFTAWQACINHPKATLEWSA